MMRIGVRNLEEALRGMGGGRDLERGLALHLGRLDATIARAGGPSSAPARGAASEGEPLSDLFLALCESVAQKYLEREDAAQAPHVIWEAFAARPRLAEYRALREWALKADVWTEWREKAWDLLAEKRGDAVAILLWEGHLEEAWQEATARGASDEEWLELARRREQDHPAAAAEIYRDQIGRLLTRSDAAAYRDAVKWLRRMESVLAHLGRSADFADFLGTLRADPRRRPRWNRTLDEAFGPGTP